MNRRLYRSVTDRRLGGVAAGTAAFFDIDPTIARVLWLLLAIFTWGGFFLVYLVMWAIVPEEPWGPGQAAPPGAVPPAGDAEGDGGGEGDASAATSASAGGVTPAGWSPTVGVKPSSGPGPHVIFGAVLIFIGVWFLAQQFVPWLNFGMLWPIGLVVIGALILVAAFRRGT